MLINVYIIKRMYYIYIKRRKFNKHCVLEIIILCLSQNIIFPKINIIILRIINKEQTKCILLIIIEYL